MSKTARIFQGQKSGAHTHLVCTSEMRRKMRAEAAVCVNQVQGFRMHGSRLELCSKWAVTLLTPVTSAGCAAFEVRAVHLQPPLRLSSRLPFSASVSNLLSVFFSPSVSNALLLSPAPPQPHLLYLFPLLSLPPPVCLYLLSPPSSFSCSSSAVTRRSKLETCVTSSH